MSKQFVNDVVSIAILATCWHEVPMPPLEGEVPNEREAEGFVRKLSKKTPQSARSGCQLPFQGSQGGFAARVARLATPTGVLDYRGVLTFVTRAIVVNNSFSALTFLADTAMMIVHSHGTAAPGRLFQQRIVSIN